MTTEASFDTLGRTPQLPLRVATAISSEIIEGRLRTGDRLPTEAALAQRFGVSRSVIREAIARLRSDGIVRSRQGVGVFVVGFEQSMTLKLDADLLSDRRVFSSVFELRAILEIRAAAMAATRADEAQRAHITEAFRRMETAENWTDLGVTADLDFHRAVAAGSDNPYIAAVVGMLAGQMRQSISFMRHNQSDPGGHLQAMNIAEHRAIHDAVLAGDARAAREAMRLHITSAARRLGYTLDDAAIENGGA
jgi:DNA-binding FadR family transcriptional regulator